jgi:hypothetical protein
MTLIGVCWVSAPCGVRLPLQCLRLTTAGRIACSARQLVAATPGVVRKAQQVLALVGEVLEQLAVG